MQGGFVTAPKFKPNYFIVNIVEQSRQAVARVFIVLI